MPPIAIPFCIPALTLGMYTDPLTLGISPHHARSPPLLLARRLFSASACISGDELPRGSPPLLSVGSHLRTTPVTSSRARDKLPVERRIVLTGGRVEQRGEESYTSKPRKGKVMPLSPAAVDSSSKHQRFSTRQRAGSSAAVCRWFRGGAAARQGRRGSERREPGDGDMTATRRDRRER
nr:unnamed protein product [Digitaria exilis]